MTHPKLLTTEKFTNCVPLLKTYPFKPYGHYSHKIGEQTLEKLFLSRIEESIKRKSSVSLYTILPSGDQGLIIFNRLAWDSQQLGFGVGQIEYLIASGDYEIQYAVKEALLTALLEACLQQDLHYFIARVNTSDLSSIHILERHGFITVDGILTFSLDLRNERWPLNSSCYEIRLFQPQDIEQIKDIARSSYMYDRFHSDSLIPKAVADELHAVWLENSCLGKAADAVVVAVDKGRILGFATCKIDRQTTQHLGLTIGTIVLVATAADVRRQGIAKAVTYGALEWFRSQGVDIVEVGTQLRNIPASRLYESCGFQLIASSLSLRKWID